MKWALLIAGLSTIGATLANLARPWPLKIIFDNVISDAPLPSWLGFLGPFEQRGDTSLIAVLAAVIVLLAALAAVFQYVQTMITTRVGHRLVSRLRVELFEHMQDVPLRFHLRARRGELITKAVSDTQRLKETFSDHSILLVSNILTLTALMAMMFLVNWRLTMIPLMSLPLLVALYLYFQTRLRASVRSQRKREGLLNTHLSEILGSMSTVAAFGRDEHEAEKFRQNNKNNLDEGIRSTQIGAAMNAAIGVVSSLGLALVVFFGAVGVNNGQLTFGDLLVFTTYVRGIYRPVKQLVKLSPKFTRAAVSAARIGEVFAIDPGIRDRPDAIVLSGLAGRVEFQDVGFRYDDSPVLQNVSFEIRPGEQVAIVGPSGAGKTTVASLLLRLYEPDEGLILLDGQDIRSFQRHSVRHQIGYVPQDSLLFGTTIAENIAYGMPDATPQQIESAAYQANIAEFISSLPNGYDTVIGEMGGTLSGGQRQRIAIARALVKQPSMLILDEPTSSLDDESREEIVRTLTDMFILRTVIAITHDRELARHFERAIHFAHGGVVCPEDETTAEVAGMLDPEPQQIASFS